MINAAGSETSPPPQYPCFEHPTLTDLLDAAGSDLALLRSLRWFHLDRARRH